MFDGSTTENDNTDTATAISQLQHSHWSPQSYCQSWDLLNHKLLWSPLSICSTTREAGEGHSNLPGNGRGCVCVQSSSDKTRGNPKLLISSTRGRSREKKSQRNVFRNSSKSSRYHLCLSIAEWLLRCFHVKVRKLFSHHLSSLVLSAPSVTKSLQELPFPLPNPALAEPPTFLQL